MGASILSQNALTALSVVVAIVSKHRVQIESIVPSRLCLGGKRAQYDSAIEGPISGPYSLGIGSSILLSPVAARCLFFSIFPVDQLQQEL
jgi:hypothetical protein